MSGLQDLQGAVSQIYHEKQQPGSMLCAQHALNNLLQANFFTAAELSAIARELDDLEESYDEGNTGNTSNNMDDTGFFSVQVLDKALEIWGLNLTPWRSEGMRPHQNHPEKIPAFILNLEQHWFTLRRFGDASPLIEVDEGNGLWFNLNSFLPSPEWLSKTYLGMVIQQAEAEGYSVFAITQADPYKPLALFRTQVDMLFSFIAEPTSLSTQGLDNSLATLKGSVQQKANSLEHETLDEDDYELQQALQASLMGTDTSTDQGDLSPITMSTPPLVSASVSGTNPELDPVAASMERNRLLLQRMRQEQEFAQRELWSSESELSGEEQAALEQRRARQRRQEEEEAMELRRAIEESEALARHQLRAPSQPAGAVGTSRRLGRPPDEEQLRSTGRASHEGGLQALGTPPTPGLTDPDTDTDNETQESVATLDEPGQRTAPTLEEIRQARLARFGQ